MRKRPKPKTITNAAKPRKPVLQAANDNRPTVVFRSAERLRDSLANPDRAEEYYSPFPSPYDNVPIILGPSSNLAPVLPGRFPVSLTAEDMAIDADETVANLIYAAALMARALGVETDPPQRRRKAAAQFIISAHMDGLLMEPEYGNAVTGCIALTLMSSVPINDIATGKIEWCDIHVGFASDGHVDFQVYVGSLAQYTAWMKRR